LKSDENERGDKHVEKAELEEIAKNYGIVAVMSSKGREADVGLRLLRESPELQGVLKELRET